VADLHILRHHDLGLLEARKLAFRWAEEVENDFGMSCTYEEGKTADEVCFTRSGVNGTLSVTRDSFELKAKLGFLVGAFKAKIESEIVRKLDAMLPSGPVAKKGVTRKK
jgi:putative polyhydroxyalkanoate system protein